MELTTTEDTRLFFFQLVSIKFICMLTLDAPFSTSTGTGPTCNSRTGPALASYYDGTSVTYIQLSLLPFLDRSSYIS